MRNITNYLGVTHICSEMFQRYYYGKGLLFHGGVFKLGVLQGLAHESDGLLKSFIVFLEQDPHNSIFRSKGENHEIFGVIQAD